MLKFIAFLILTVAIASAYRLENVLPDEDQSDTSLDDGFADTIQRLIRTRQLSDNDANVLSDTVELDDTDEAPVGTAPAELLADDEKLDLAPQRFFGSWIRMSPKNFFRYAAVKTGKAAVKAAGKSAGKALGKAISKAIDKNQQRGDCSGVQPIDRRGCGWIGATQDQCSSIGCCYDSSVANVHWCFHPAV